MTLFLIACIDNEIQNTNPKEETFDTGTGITVPIDTDESTVDTDSGTITIPDDDCADYSVSSAGHTLSTIEDCEGVGQTEPTWELAYKWTAAAGAMTLATVAIGNLTDDNGNGKIDDDDTPDVVHAPYSGYIAAYSGDDGSTLWSVSSSNIEQSTPAIGDLDGDGFPEVFVGGLYGSMAVHGEDGSTYWTGPGADSIKMYCGGVGMADLDADGDAEVYIGREILEGQTGSVLGKGSYGNATSIAGEAPNSTAADIDLDGQQEVIVGNAAYDINGDALFYNGGSDGFPAVANFDGDDEAEIVVISSNTVRLLDTDGSEIWSKTVSSSGGYFGPPAVADFDGDGDPDIAVPLYPGVAVLDGDGNILWQQSGTSGSFFDGVSAYDLDGDGDWEVLHVGSGGLTIYQGSDGTVLSTLPAAQSYCGQMPVVADLDNDDHVEMAFATYQDGVYVMQDLDDEFTAGFEIWNQHAFSITNVTEMGEIEASPEMNWETGYNNFRAGPPVNAVFPTTNLTPNLVDLCTDECDDGVLYVTWQVGNEGTETQESDFVVEFWGTTDSGLQLLYSTVYTSDIPGGWMEDSVTTTITAVPSPLYDLTIMIDYGSSEADEIGECDETDNEDSIASQICF